MLFSARYRIAPVCQDIKESVFYTVSRYSLDDVNNCIPMASKDGAKYGRFNNRSDL